MKLKGKITVVIPAKSGTTDKGDWQSQQYVMETIEEYPKKMLFEVFGESKIKEFDIKQDEVLPFPSIRKWMKKMVITTAKTAHMLCRENDFFIIDR